MSVQKINDARELIDRQMYEFYKTKRKKVARGIDQYKLWRKAIAGLIITMKEMLVENENGVYIEGFGYFYIEFRRVHKKRISIIKKIENKTYGIRFKFEDEKLRRKYNYSVGIVNIFPRKLEYEPKFEAIQHEIQLKKQLKIKQ